MIPEAHFKVVGEFINDFS